MYLESGNAGLQAFKVDFKVVLKAGNRQYDNTKCGG